MIPLIDLVRIALLKRLLIVVVKRLFRILIKPIRAVRKELL